MNENISPLSVAEQIEVLEAAKENLVALSDCYNSIGLCRAIETVICDKYNHLSELVVFGGAFKVIPSFNFPHAVLSGTVSDDAVPYWYWWPTDIEKGGITNRLAFLNFLINKLKNENHE